ncbi:DUF3027 domain-containing protein [Crossiella sp. CA-258035]|uniref:DUF3027 domain-containing protein n=1 Tax=Crossiella sp. CA-258035 TaxID=2981138 RepID=UPI0024BC17D3|nr:DUF3027 domain-containing protein [Crossiella sp. CA-258035]WHT23451.1 DUF3027 domain-containing protein [Crossiella sp. CA-258035]
MDGTQASAALVNAVPLAQAAAAEAAEGEEVGGHVGTAVEDPSAVTHFFEAAHPGYTGWRWAVTVSQAGGEEPVTVSEVVLLPGPQALVAPDWVPWNQRVKAGDLGVGDLLPTSPDDHRLVPGYLQSDDPAVEEVTREVGLGRMRVLSWEGRAEAAARWTGGDFGPGSDMARSAPGSCAGCGFFLPLAGSLRAAFGVCGNEYSPADGRVVHAEYGCGAHSEAEVDTSPLVPVAEVIYDDAMLDIEQRPSSAGTAPSPAGSAPEHAAETATEAAPETAVEAAPEAAPEPAAEAAPEAAPAEPAAEPVEAEAILPESPAANEAQE